MHRIGDHVCTLPKEPKCTDIAPTAAWWRRLLCYVGHAGLACDWHRGAVDNLRSRVNVKLEQTRHIASGRWYILHPYSPARFAWQCWIAALWTLTLVYVPFLAFTEVHPGGDPVMSFANRVAAVDIIINFISGYYDPRIKQIVLEPAKIAINYIKGSFLFDLLAAAPFSSFGLLPPNALEKKEKCFYIVNILRFYSLSTNCHVAVQQLDVCYATVTLTVIAAKALFFFHWLAYIYYQFPIFMAHFRNGTIPNNSWLSIKEVIHEEHTPLNLYTASFFYVMGLAIGTGYYNPMDDHLVDEILLTSAIAVAGLVFIAYAMMVLLRLGMNYCYQVNSFNANLKEMEDYMKALRLPAHLQHRTLLHINHKFDGHIFNEETIMNALSEPMKQEIALSCSRRLLESSSLCKHLPHTLLGVIASFVKFETYLPGDTLIESGQLCDSMYLIARGTAAVFAPDGEEVRHLKSEYQFGEVALLSSSERSNATVRAIEICSVHRLQSADFQQCLAPYPHLKREAEEISSGLSSLDLLTDDHNVQGN